MNPIRSSGCIGSIGRYAAPAFSTASIATIASAERLNNNPTQCPGATPRPISTRANRSDASSTSRYVHDRPSNLIAAASGLLDTCAANDAGTEVDAVTEAVSAERLPIASNRARSPRSSASTEDSRRPGSTAIVPSTRRSRSTIVATRSSSNTSASYSTRRPISLPGCASTVSG